ncbi:MAG: cytochrome c oxidase accessory protein CcoG [Polyangiales bacterium]|nr:cytochrome c oxidase accessory protein CcoG [Sandaracinaceae bacterium]
MSKRPLPVIDEPASSLHVDGRRNYVHPADVHGRFLTRRRIVFAVLIAVYVALPFVHVGGRPAVFLDVAHRRFFLFGLSLNAQDFWLAFFVLSGIGFALFVVTTLYGRIWCGYACPHSVFLEGVFRPIERLIEGPRNIRMRRNQGPMSWDKLWRKTLKHALFVLTAFLMSHFVLSYFTSLPALLDMMRSGPSEHTEAFVWMLAMSGVIYFNFAWFREQLCLVVCPYGRLQSALIDSDTLVIGYDTARGEPRGKVGTSGAGDCVDCRRCVVVCPTGIDIRNGLQMECVGCAQCIDACDDVMRKLSRPVGLVRYDSLNGLDGKARRVLRPRVYFYAVLGVMGLVAATLALSSRQAFEVNLLRTGAPFAVDAEGHVLDILNLHLVNKRDEQVRFRIEPVDPNDGLLYRISDPNPEVPALESARISVFATWERGAPNAPSTAPAHVRLRIISDHGDESRVAEVSFVAPR